MCIELSVQILRSIRLNWNRPCVAALWARLAARAIVMRLPQILCSRGLGRASSFVAITLLSVTLASIGPPAVAGDPGDDNRTSQEQHPAEGHSSDESHPAPQNTQSSSSTASTAKELCGVLATAATSNDLPVDFFTRLIWQESRFKPDASAQKALRAWPSSCRKLRG